MSITYKSHIMPRHGEQRQMIKTACIGKISGQDIGGMFSSPREIDVKAHRFPFCIVWTPIPCITWFVPFIGHIGIATSRGIIRDFAGPYFVSEDRMGFGWPTRYWQLEESRVPGRADGYDKAIKEASDEYRGRMHNLFCDNCHSHVAMALNKMRYDGKSNWNMFNLAFYMLFYGRSIDFKGFLKQWLPSIILLILMLVLFLVIR